MVKAIIFDCFGVLCSDGWIPFKQQQFGGDSRLAQEATDLNRQANAGLISSDDFLQGIAELAGMGKSQVLAAISRNVPDEELFKYIRVRLKPEYRIGLLSNAGSNMLPDLFTDEQISLFDAVALSYETGHVKPSPGAYTGLAEDLGVQPEECVFVDDQERHCSGAREAGMQAVLFENFEQCREELERLLRDPKH